MGDNICHELCVRISVNFFLRAATDHLIKGNNQIT